MSRWDATAIRCDSAIEARRAARETERRDIQRLRKELYRQERLIEAQLTALVLREEELFDQEDEEWHSYTRPLLREAGLV